jgi:hypothetical protein
MLKELLQHPNCSTGLTEEFRRCRAAAAGRWKLAAPHRISPRSPFGSTRYIKYAEHECAAFRKRTGRIIKLLTVQGILDEVRVQKT